MLFFITTSRHRYTIDGYLSVWGATLAPAIFCLPYEDLFEKSRLPKATYVFTDFDRLNSEDLEKAGRIYSTLRDQGATAFNDPKRYRPRLESLQALYQAGVNKFNAFEPCSWPGKKFPVFLRRNNGHEGPLTDLLWNSQDVSDELSRWSSHHKDLLVVEYLDYSDEAGRFWKESRFRVGEKIVPAGVVTGKSWSLKAAEIVDEVGLEFEAAASRDKSHDDFLMKCFEDSGIEYGRIDYTLIDGKPQVFEINTNPDLGVPCSPTLERWPLRTEYYSQLNMALWHWTRKHPSSSSIKNPVRPPGAHKVALSLDYSAFEGVRDLGDFLFVPGLDSPGGDLHFEESRELDKLMAWCRANPACQGFNTLGFLKRELQPPHEFQPSGFFTPEDGLYIFKERYSPSYTFYGDAPKMVGPKPIVQTYSEPKQEVRDMMVIVPYFNFTHYYRLAQNLLHVRETLRSSNIPYRIVEVAFKDEPFCLSSGEHVLQFRTESRMFYKENLLNVGASHTPPEYTKLFFLDADVIYGDPSWYSVVRQLLKSHTAVHAYTNRFHLSPQFQIRGKMEYSRVALGGTSGACGQAWAVSRDWFEEYGLFDNRVLGCSELPFVTSAFAPLTIFHLPHDNTSKQHHRMAEELVQDFLRRQNLEDIADVLERNSDGLLQWRIEYRAELNELMGQYAW